MSWARVFVWSKKVHRGVMWVVVALGLAMTGTGLVMHRALEGEWIPEQVDLVKVRQWHNQVSKPFAVALGVMTGTGLVMWGVPKIRNRREP